MNNITRISFTVGNGSKLCGMPVEEIEKQFKVRVESIAIPLEGGHIIYIEPHKFTKIKKKG